MDKALEQAVRDRAGGLCEYCHAMQWSYPERFQIDHVIAKQHGGLDAENNLALCCLECNRRKGPNIASIDPVTRQIVRLFHPRQDRWSEHFIWNRSTLVGMTSIGRATVALLDINRLPRLVVRESLIAEKQFPPEIDRV